uniref:Uncharacterized protein TCIL3000_11_10730 n=1 Tax=Trypanosoma congolense (strain IL3000) TaxID=1068625 RepID=G0V1S5_TRYCI|nr:unnamed protein product [Trypanosoma congolense IL3000]
MKNEKDDAACVGQWVGNMEQCSDDNDSFARSAAVASNSLTSVAATTKPASKLTKKGTPSPQKNAANKNTTSQGLLPQIKAKPDKQSKAAPKKQLGTGSGGKGRQKGAAGARAPASLSTSSRSMSAVSVGKRKAPSKTKGSGKVGPKGGKRTALGVRQPSHGSISSHRGSRGSRSSSRQGKRGAGGRSSKGGKSGKGKRSTGSAGAERHAIAVSSLIVAEEDQRSSIWAAEDAERDLFLPDYHLLVINMLRSQIIEMNARQQVLNDALASKKGQGLHLIFGDDPAAALDVMRIQTRLEMQKEMDELTSQNAALRGVVEEKKAELEAKSSEAQTLRDKVNRRLARFEVDCEALRTEVQSVLKTSHLNVERMKQELSHRLDVATASLRTPKYDTALRSMQELVQSVRDEIQEHHDTLSKLIVSIEAQDTFARDKSDSMHTNLPARYRDELRKLDNDKLLNLLDILSFHDSVVETVGKSLYVIKTTGHVSNVF